MAIKEKEPTSFGFISEALDGIIDAIFNEYW